MFFKTFFELKVDDEIKKAQLSDSLRQLIVILFAVVFGVGLKKIGELSTQTDPFTWTRLFSLSVVYYAILLSWWGYNMALIIGPIENNKLCYIVDILLLVLYWLLLHFAFNIQYILGLFTLMYGLYTVWEVIRIWYEPKLSNQLTKIKKACLANILFFLIFSLITLNNFNGCKFLHLPDNLTLLIVAILLTIYRIWIGKIYIKSKHEGNASMSDNIINKLIENAKEASEHALCKLSKFRVGAAILTSKGNIYKGCNIEFDNYSNTIHAEMSAISNAVSSGEKSFNSISVYTPGDRIFFPCGMCLQSLFELGGSELIVIACNDKQSEQLKVGDLLTRGFKLG